MDNLIEIESNEQFENLNKDGIVVIDFWAEWCMPCKMMLPVIDSLAQDNPEVTFLKVNVDRQPEIASRYGVRNIPTFHFLNEGESVEKKIGQSPQSQMQEVIDAIEND